MHQAEGDIEPPALPAGQRTDLSSTQLGEFEITQQFVGPDLRVRPWAFRSTTPASPTRREPAGCGRLRSPARRTRDSIAPRFVPAAMSNPAIRALPDVGSSKVVSMRNVVDFPAPFGPSKATNSPSATSSVTPLTASTSFLP